MNIHKKIILQKYKSVLIVQATLFIVLIVCLGLSNDKSINSEILQTAALIMSIGYLSVIIYPILFIQKKLFVFLKKSSNGSFKGEKIYDFIFIGLFYLAAIGLVAFVFSFIASIDIVPVFFSLPGVMFLFTLLGNTNANYK